MEMESQFTQKHHQPPHHQYFMADYYVVTIVRAIILIKQILGNTWIKLPNLGQGGKKKKNHTTLQSRETHEVLSVWPSAEIVRAMTHVINQGMAMYWGTSRWSAMEIMVISFPSLNGHWASHGRDDGPLLYCASQIRCFYQLKVCGNPASSKSIGAIFPTSLAHFVSL